MPSTAAADASSRGVAAVERQQLGVVAVQDRHHLQRMALAGAHHPVQQLQRHGGVTTVDGVGEVPRRHATGVAEERLRRRPPRNVSRVAVRRHAACRGCPAAARRPRPASRPAAARACASSFSPAALICSSNQPDRSRARRGRRGVDARWPPAFFSASVSALAIRPPPADQHQLGGRQRVVEVGDQRRDVVGVEPADATSHARRACSVRNGDVCAASTTARISKSSPSNSSTISERSPSPTSCWTRSPIAVSSSDSSSPVMRWTPWSPQIGTSPGACTRAMPDDQHRPRRHTTTEQPPRRGPHRRRLDAAATRCDGGDPAGAEVGRQPSPAAASGAGKNAASSPAGRP